MGIGLRPQGQTYAIHNSLLSPPRRLAAELARVQCSADETCQVPTCGVIACRSEGFARRNHHHQLRLEKSLPKMVLKSSGVDQKAVSEKKRVLRRNLDPKRSPSSSPGRISTKDGLKIVWRRTGSHFREKTCFEEEFGPRWPQYGPR